MNFIPNTDKQRQEMLQTIGLKSIEELFVDVKKQGLLLSGKLKLPEKMSEIELQKHLSELASKNANAKTHSYFLGGGAYNHFQPTVVPYLLSRGELWTAYTPYQAEISQGILQSIFEWQTLICQLTSMDVSNASSYCASSAFAEAAIMARTHFRGERAEILVSKAANPEYREVLKTYCWANDMPLKEIDFSDGVTNPEQLKEKITEKTAAVIVQYPNYFGLIEDLEEIEKIVHEKGALFVVAVGDATCLGLLKAPGDFKTDIVTGDAQAFGLPLSYGGPYAGFTACTKALLRTLPGRVVGKTLDTEGKEGFILTLQAREQHIRRDKAFSNLCTNSGLCALAATIYLAVAGKQGLAKVANQSFQKTHYLFEELTKLQNVKSLFKAPFYNEFALQFNDAKKVKKELEKNKIIAGIELEKDYRELKNSLLFCATELNTKEEIDKFVAIVKGVQ